jgi:hypothetical protein
MQHLEWMNDGGRAAGDEAMPRRVLIVAELPYKGKKLMHLPILAIPSLG